MTVVHPVAGANSSGDAVLVRAVVTTHGVHTVWSREPGSEEKKGQQHRCCVRHQYVHSDNDRVGCCGNVPIFTCEANNGKERFLTDRHGNVRSTPSNPAPAHIRGPRVLCKEVTRQWSDRYHSTDEKDKDEMNRF